MGRPTRLWLALGINLALSAGLLVASRAAHSTGLVADAGHNLTDAMALVLALVATTLALRPTSERRSFGYARASILAALANGVVLVVVTLTIAVLAIERLIHPRPIHGAIVLVAAGLSMAANLAVVGLLRRDDHDLGVRSALVHALGDTLSAGVVAMAGLIAMVASGPLALRVDPIASLIVAAFIVLEAIRVTGSSLHVLLEGVPDDVDLAQVRQSLGSLPGILDVHDLHVWTISTTSRALSAHLVVEGDASVASTTVLISEIKALLETDFAIDHATIELEAEGCDEHPSHP